MKTVFSRLTSLTAALAAVAMLTLGAASGAQAADLKILVVNQATVFQNSLAGKDRSKKLQEIFKAIQDDEAKEMEPLKQEAITLQQQKAILSAEDFGKKQVDLQRRVQFAQYKFEQERAATERAAQQLMFSKLYPVLNEVMQEKKGTLLMDQSQVLMVSPDFNVTDEVVKRMDAKSPSIDLKRITWAEIEAVLKKQQEALQAQQGGQ